jgi:transposase
MTEEQLDECLFKKAEVRSRDLQRPEPDWPTLGKEFKRKGVTLRLLWQEYRENYSEGYGYSQFCQHYRSWSKTLPVSMRQNHKAGEKLFVDYAGMTMPVNDAKTGQVVKVQIFVSALGASQYIYAEATRTQRLSDWIGSHVRTFEFLGGVTEIVVPDNLKSGVTKACRYEPSINQTYADMASFYGVAVIPARPRKPKDKSKVENAVQIVEREILARLRDRTFFSLAELNHAIKDLLMEVNKRKLQKLDTSRLKMFEEIDKPALKSLPFQRYEYGQFFQPKVNIDYHIEILGHFYSVPFHLRSKRMDVRVTSRMVEVLYQGKRVATHVRDDRKGKHTTDPSHMPKAHQKHLEWSPGRLIQWASKDVGIYCSQVVEQIIKSREHPEQAYRSCLGLMRLSKSYDPPRVESACHRALVLEVCSYQSIKSILKTGTDYEPLPNDECVSASCQVHHQNIRGKDYYNTSKTKELTNA